jgi:DNA-binding MarR family transcriptional regulator
LWASFLGVNDTTGLERMVCFNLYAASRATAGLYRPALEAVGLTYPQYVAMRVIWHRGSVTVGELGRALDLDSGTLSPLLKRLAAQGLIRRERGTQDERTVRVTATAKGAELRDRVADLPERVACAVDLSPEEFAQLHHLLSRVRTSATAHTI